MNPAASNFWSKDSRTTPACARAERADAVDFDNAIHAAQINGDARPDRQGSTHQARTTAERNESNFFVVGKLHDAANLVGRLRAHGANRRMDFWTSLRMNPTLAQSIPR